MAWSQATSFSSASRVKQGRQITWFLYESGTTRSHTSSGTSKPTRLTLKQSLQISRVTWFFCKGSDMAYRKTKGSDTWHYCKNCSKWPASNYEESQSKPSSGELCNECRGKESNGSCQK